MWIIIGLGNPGRDYTGTRHNVGFEVLNKLAYDYNMEFNKAKHRADIAEGVIAGQKVVLAKPQTFMNLSGESVRDMIQFYKPEPDHWLVVYDDVSLAPGEIRVREHGTAGGHNGIKNIIYQLETDVFLRVRVGIGEKPAKWDLADYVLSKFSKQEMDDVIEGITKAGNAVAAILREGPRAAMNQYNHKTGAKHLES